MTTGNVSNNLDFFSFLSVAYGSGNVAFDFMILGGAMCCLVAIVGVLQVVGFGRAASGREEEVLVEVSELLNEMHVQISELRSTVNQEFEKYRGDLGYIRQELQELNFAYSSRMHLLDSKSEEESYDDYYDSRFGRVSIPAIV